MHLNLNIEILKKMRALSVFLISADPWNINGVKIGVAYNVEKNLPSNP